MKKLQASCKKFGELYLPSPYSLTKDNFSETGFYEDYTFKSAEELHRTATRFKNVNRNGKVVNGGAYTLRMAHNDFKRFAKL